jgi:hypothetical protein
MSNTPKYSVVPGNHFTFVEARLAEVEDSDLLEDFVFELFTQLV